MAKNIRNNKNEDNNSCGSAPANGVQIFTLIGVIVAVIFLVLISNNITTMMGTPIANNEIVKEIVPVKVAAKQPSTAPDINMENLIGGNAIKGDINAKVTMVEFSDYECPYCARYYKNTYPQIISEYVDTGKVKIVFRDYPLPFHGKAQKAGEAAECAGEQDKYYEMHDKLFDIGLSGGVASYKEFAADLGLNQADFDSCLDSGAQASEIQNDMKAGQAVGVTGTPGFIINGELVSGAQPFSAFKAVIDRKLAE